MTRGHLLVTATLISVLPGLASASDAGRSRPVDFIGVFHPEFVGARVDSARCPDASHPLLLLFRGEADTTLGHATLEQSHCEGLDHASFRHGRQTVTLASGDQLFGIYSGDLLVTPTTATDGKLIIDGLYRNVGGTGRLANARGRGISAGTVDTATGGAEVTVSGTL